ncbi:FmdB family zinc ribbon protein [candidate division KSB1 bacterium]
MPLFEYKCRNCDNTMTFLVGVSDQSEDIRCKKCGSFDLEKLISGSYIRINNNHSIKANCGKETTCCGSSAPCENRPCDN